MKICIFFVLLTTAAHLSAQTFTTLFQFNGADGAYPEATLTQGIDGNFYGVTDEGGTANAGTVFKITPTGVLTTLYNFCSQSACADGSYPFKGLVQVADGNFYGTTSQGGGNCAGLGSLGCGTIFKITPAGVLTTLYRFCAQNGCPDGSSPQGALMQAPSGELYGTTPYGGANGADSGTIFKLTLSGTLTTLYSFCSQSGCTDGASPTAGLIQAANGNFYGTASRGGIYSCSPYPGCGTIFEFTQSGTLTTIYSFCSVGGCADGSYPYAGLTQATNGNFYGTTFYGGSNSFGTVFEVTPTGTLTTLHSFCTQSGCPDGVSPIAGLMQATNGQLYGTTSDLGPKLGGTLFSMTPVGTLTTLYSFCPHIACTNGSYPYAPPMQGTNGVLYGTTNSATSSHLGTVYSLSLGLGPFVEPQNTSGRVGTVVRILGTGLTGTSSVTFNGSAAVFKTGGNSVVYATVPAGATSGTIQVTTPGGILSSNVPFEVLP